MHDKVSISIVNIHQATTGRCDMQKQVNYHIHAMIDASPGQRRIMGGNFNAAVSRHGYAESTRSRFERLDKQSQHFVKSTGGILIEAVAHTRRDLVRGSSATLDHSGIIAWNLTIESKSEVCCVGPDCNDHALISCTIGGGLLTYRDLVDQAQDTGKPRLIFLTQNSSLAFYHNSTKAQRYHASNSPRNP